MTKIKLLILFLIVLSACSTASIRMLPGENGLNLVSVRDIEKHKAEEEAVEAAQDYCKDHGGKEAIFPSGSANAKYTGTMDENTRDTVRKASKAAVILAPGVGVGSRSGTAGGVLGGAGTAGSIMTSGKDYQVELQFRCQ